MNDDDVIWPIKPLLYYGPRGQDGLLALYQFNTDTGWDYPIRSWGSLTEPMQPKYYLKKHLL